MGRLKWCDECHGKGIRGLLSGTLSGRLCPTCKGSGFSNATPEQARDAERLAHIEAANEKRQEQMDV